jgi:mannosyltransferase OCH1-like enzyme
MTTTASRKALLLAATLFVSVALLPGLYILNELSKPTTVHIGLTTDGESSLKVCVPAARYIAPAVLRDMNDAGVIEHTARGLPKIIHQSWLDLDLPVKFKHWSDSFRMKHPDWVWVCCPSQCVQKMC